MTIKRIGDFSFDWAESLCWDDRSCRLYFVDATSHQLLWLDNAQLPLYSITLPSMMLGIGLAEDGRLLGALGDGLYLIDPDSSAFEKICDYPKQLGKRANDGTVDSMGNFVTGSLKEAEVGSYWCYSSHSGWRLLDTGIHNANGPVTIYDGSKHVLIFADTPAKKLYAYDYDPVRSEVKHRRVFADTSKLHGQPDGACATSAGDVLSCLIGPGLIARYNQEGLLDTITAGSEQPSDICFGGSNLDRLFVVSIKAEFGHGIAKSKLAGALVEVLNTGLVGVKENRFRL